MIYDKAVRPVLFSMPPESAHAVAEGALSVRWPWQAARAVQQWPQPMPTRLGRFEIAHPLGLAPGFDKDGKAFVGLDQLGFGYVTIGSVTKAPRSGNPRPRVVRYPEREAVINCLGLPSLGIDRVLPRLQVIARHKRSKCVVSLAGHSVAEYVEMHAAVEPFVDAVEFGLQCPNDFEDDGGLHRAENVDALFRSISKTRTKPIIAKILPYADATERDNRLALVDICLRYGVDAVVIPGTHVAPEPRLSMGKGNLCGRTVLAQSLQNVRDIRSRFGMRIAIIANGGISTGAEAFEALRAGASAVEVLSVLFYRGPLAAWHILRELTELLQREKIGDLRELHG